MQQPRHDGKLSTDLPAERLVSGFAVDVLLQTPTVTVSDVVCAGESTHRSDVETSARTHLVFPYRGTYVRHLGEDEVVADASQVLFFNAGDPYQVSHPIPGGDASLVIQVADAMLREMAPKDLLREGDALAFRMPRLRIDPRAQALVALLRHSLREGIAEPLEAES